MPAKVLVRKGKTTGKSKKPVVGSVCARPGMIAIGCGDEGEGPITYMTEEFCIFDRGDGKSTILRWEEVVLGRVRPDPRFSLRIPRRKH